MSTILSNKHGGFVTQFENTNFSTAKQKFSFGKGARFQSQKRSETELQYTLPDSFGRRAPSFGIGDRFDFIKIASKHPLTFIQFDFRQSFS